jgi:membrane-associated phospholipid phosphatase
MRGDLASAPAPAPAAGRGLPRRRRRPVAVLAYAVAIGAWTWFVGMPNDTIQIVLWLWLGTIAWNVDAEPRRHLEFLRDWWAPVLALVVYFYSRGLADELHRDVSVQMPIDVDRWLFGGTLPTETLQLAWCGNPCDPGSDPRWYDLLFTTVYASHFVTGLTVAAVLWVRNRQEFSRWMRRLLAISYGALAVYVAYPMAPPWWASRDGYVDGDLHRITGRGWEDIGIERLNLLLGGVGNKVAAMPSLHAGIAFLVAVWAVHRLRSPWRWTLLLYPVAMGVTLVYYAEHYVVDILAGWALGVLVLVGCSLWERWRHPHLRAPVRDAGSRTASPAAPAARR